MKKAILFISFVAIFLVNIENSQAVMPPDFIFNIGAQVVQIFSLMMIFLTAIISVSYQYIKVKAKVLIKNKFLLAGSIVLVVGVILGSSYMFVQYRQTKTYEQWLFQSQEYEKEYLSEIGEASNTDPLNKLVTDSSGQQAVDSDGDGLSDQDEINIYNTDPNNPDTDGDSYDDKTEIENGYDPLAEQNKIEKDPNLVFIEKYYTAIGTRSFQEAYDLSKKHVDLTTFSSWYKNTTSVIIDKHVRIDDTRSSIELTLFEGNTFTRYAVLMELEVVNNLPTQVKSSKVSTLGTGFAEKGDDTVPAKETPTEPIQSQGISISNADFQSKIDSNKDYIVLDAREDLEFKNGNFPNSTHIRFADLKAGRWIELPSDTDIYVLCWSGIRGREVAEFLRTKNLPARYLVEGANGWVEAGGTWNGNIKFSQKYSESRYRLVYSTKEFTDKRNKGAFIVDSREPYKFNKWHVPGSVNIPIMYTPSINIQSTFAQVPANSEIIVVCDNYVNCFDAKITGVELEDRGHKLLGRYNSPWEYKNDN